MDNLDDLSMADLTEAPKQMPDGIEVYHLLEEFDRRVAIYRKAADAKKRATGEHDNGDPGRSALEAAAAEGMASAYEDAARDLARLFGINRPEGGRRLIVGSGRPWWKLW